jgi:LuxR family transcriptional regulator, maltose regulon positive regulatory protein
MGELYAMPARAPTEATTSDPRLTTKLYVPSVRPNYVPRPVLSDRLNAGTKGKLTLISAPAGFGKTSLLAAWLQQSEMPVAWVSLDPDDNEPLRFLDYLLGALQTVDKDFGKTASGFLKSSHPSPLRAAMIGLLNEFAALSREFVIVFDDYHVIHERAIHEAVAYLLEHLPYQAHVMISSRNDPPFPLSRLRARGELSEIRVSDLRFGIDDATAFLNGSMKLGLTQEEVAKLDDRTEGWIAGLQLSALGLQGRVDKSQLISEMAVNDRFIVDYLVEEVLNRQSPKIQEFLLATAVLDRLSSSLCNALTGDTDGQATLEQLERSNLFLFPLDNKGTWFRYHHLFADLLRLQLRQRKPEEFTQLQITASIWCEENGLLEEAINYALAAKDWERALNLIEPIVLESSGRKNLPLWEQRQVQIPDEIISKRPLLCLWNVSVFIYKGEVELATKFLGLAESAAATGRENYIRSIAASLRGLLAFGAGDHEKLEEFSRKAVSIASTDEPMAYVVAIQILAYSFYRAGEFEKAEATLLQTIPMAVELEYLATELWSQVFLALTRTAMGRLSGAADAARKILQYDKYDFAEQTAFAFPILAQLEYEWNNLEESREYLELALSTRHGMGDKCYWFNIFDCLQFLAPLVWFHDGKESALEMIDFEAERIKSYGNERGFAHAKALKAELLLRQGDFDSVDRWVKGSRIESRPSDFRNEFEHIVFARFLIAQGKHDQAFKLLSRLLPDAEKWKRGFAERKILLLQALALKHQGNENDAVRLIERLLNSTCKEGFIRLFVDEGEEVANLLLLALKQNGKRWETETPDLLRYVLKLNEAFGVSGRVQKTSKIERENANLPWWYLNDPLSEREIEVLQLVAQGLSNQAIGNKIFISPGTVKRHLNNIYQKLDVHSRVQAIELARRFGLITPPN